MGWAVPRDPVDADFGREGGDAVRHQVHICFLRQGTDGSRRIFVGQGGALQDMQKLQLDAEGSHPVDGVHGLQDFRPGFAGQAQDGVDDHGKAQGAQALHGVVKDPGRIAPANPQRRGVVDRLQTQLDPDELVRKSRPKAGQAGQNLFVQAVRPGGDGDAGGFREGKGFPKQGDQPVRIPVGIGVGLKIGDQAGRLQPPLRAAFRKHAGGAGNAVRPFVPQPVRAFGQPGAEGIAAGDGEVPAAACGAEGTAFRARGAVPVGAGTADVQRYLIQLSAEGIFTPSVQGVPGLVVPVRLRGGRRKDARAVRIAAAHVSGCSLSPRLRRPRPLWDRRLPA